MRHLITKLLTIGLAIICQAGVADDSSALLVSATIAKTASIEKIYSGIGQVKPSRLTHVSSQFGGRIVQVLAATGDRVEKNQLLVRIRFNQDEGQTSEIMSSLSGYRVVANIAGRIIDQQKVYGDIVAAGDTIFTIAQETSPRISIQIPSDYRNLLDDNTRVRFDSGGTTLEKSIIRLVPYDTQGNGSFLIEVPATEDLPVFGVFVPVDVVLQTHRNNLVVPRSAIVYAEDKPFVFVIENGLAKQSFVTTGIETRDQVEILNGIKNGGMVITQGNYNLVPDSKVKVKPDA